MISIEYKLANIEARALYIEKNLTNPYPFYSNFDDTYEISVQPELLVN